MHILMFCQVDRYLSVSRGLHSSWINNGIIGFDIQVHFIYPVMIFVWKWVVSAFD